MGFFFVLFGLIFITIKQQLMFSYKQHIKHTLQLAYPIIIGQLGHIMMGVVDSLMVGRVGAVPLAAASVANGIFFIIFVVGLGISFALSPLIAIALGAGKTNEFNAILNNALFLNFITGMIIFLLIFFGSELIYYLDQPKDVAARAVSYLKIVSFSSIPMMIFQTYRQFIEGLSIMRPAMIITLIANISNAAGNWILIYGKFGLPSMELDGAGISTLLNRLLMGYLMVHYVIRSSRFQQYNLKLSFSNLDIHIIKRILRLGLPSGIQYFFEVAAFSSSAIIVGWIGTTQLAAHQIALNLASITYMAATGISAAAAIRVGNAVGKQDIKETRKAGFSSILLTISMMTLFGLIFIFFNSVLPAFYIGEPDVIEIAAGLLVIAAFFQIADGTQAVALGVLRGLTDAKVPTLITFIAYWLLCIPTGYLLAFHFGFGVYGIWMGYIVGLYASALMLTLRFHIKSKHKVEIYNDHPVMSLDNDPTSP